ncbi:Vinorine synthase [Bertholletia excelsa]
MKFQVQVIGRDTVKPSSPTPDHLRGYQLSFLDQVAPAVFMPFVLFYPNNLASENSGEIVSHLKTILSEVLTKFYPLAGRISSDGLQVDCSGAGVPFVEAQVDCDLNDVVSEPEPNEFNKLLPYELDDIRDLPMAAQINIFNCGGFAVGLVVSHKVADALSCMVFINYWAAAARGGREEGDLPPPEFVGASLFPPRNISGFRPTTGIVKENIVTKRFVFTATKIAYLRDKYTNNTSNTAYPRRPTRVEALSAFLWSRFMASTQSPVDPDKTYTLIHAVNLRHRFNPPLSDHHFGNLFRIAVSVPPVGDDAAGCEIVNSVREAIRAIDEEYMTKLKEGEKHLNFLKDRAEKVTKGEVVSFSVTSLCRFPMHEADFGWGRPIWFGSASFPFKNLVILLDTVEGDGIEAWVNLKEEDMIKFEVDEEFTEMVFPSKPAKC